MKKFLCLLVLCCIAFASDIIPFERVENCATRFVTQRFGRCTLDEVITYNSIYDEPGAYAFIFRNANNEPYTIVMGAQYDHTPINEFYQGIPRTKSKYDNILRHVQQSGYSVIELRTYYYFGPGEEYCAFLSEGREILVNACTYTILEKTVFTDNIPEPNKELDLATRRKWDAYLAANDFASRDTAYIPNVPFIDWVYGCSPCAASMIFWYWDEYAPSPQYGRLVDYFYTHWDEPEGEWNNCANVNRELALAMYTDTLTGGTFITNIRNGMVNVANGWNGYSCSGNTSPQGHQGNQWVFSWAKNEIDANRPFHWNVLYYWYDPMGQHINHSVTGVGYSIIPGDTFIIVHNTWDGAEPHWPLWTYHSPYTSYDYVVTFMPGGPVSDNLFLDEWFEGGNTITGGTVIFEDINYRIKWQDLGSNIDHVKLAYSTGRNGEAYDTTQWNIISSSVPVGNGQYTWTCPTGSQELRWNIIGVSSGNTRLAADGNYGFFDVSTLAHAAGIDLIGHIPASRYGGWHCDMQQDGDYLYIANATDGFVVVNVSDPTTPDVVANLDLPGDACCIDISGNYAYVGDNEDTLRVINISNPANPSQVGKIAVGAEALDVCVVGNYAYVAARSQGLMIIDISTPSSPSLEGQYNTTGFSYDVIVDGNYAYIADATRGVRIIDVSTPSNPTETGYYDTNGIAYGLTKVGGYVYLADGTQGIKVFDASATDTLILLGSLDTPTTATKVEYYNEGLFVADGNFGGMRVIDVANPNSPSEVGYIASMGSAENLRVYGSTVYLADGTIGVLIIDQSLYGIAEHEAEVVRMDMVVYPTHTTIDRTMTIALTATHQVQTDIKVFDCAGRCVETVFQGMLQAGENRLSWRPGKMSAGVYFIKAETEGSAHLQKVVFVK